MYSRDVAVMIVRIVGVIAFIHGCAFAQSPNSVTALSQCEDDIWPKYANTHAGRLPFATFSGSTLCLQGDITQDGANEAISILKYNDISRILVTSTGGDAYAAISMAFQMLKGNIDVYVSGICASSCANYIFLAGTRKFILKNSVVAWHGAPLPQPSDSANLLNIWEMHKVFFRMIGVDDHLTYEIPCDILKNQEFLKAQKRGESPGWTYQADIMLNKFHISGIYVDWEPQSDAELRSVPEWTEVFRSIYLSQGLRCTSPSMYP